MHGYVLSSGAVTVQLLYGLAICSWDAVSGLFRN